MCLNKAAKYPCGKCYECLSKRRSDWSIRLQEEFKSVDFAYHAILTYNNENLPLSLNGLPTLKKKDCQDFIKRLRHHFTNHISYFLAAEYGTTTQRPHYHIVIFGVPLFDDAKHVLYDIYSDKLRLLIEKCWQKGFVRRKSKYIVNDAQLHYLTKDIYNWVEPLDLHKCYLKLKDSEISRRLYESFIRNTFKPFVDANCVDDRLLPFRLFSKNLGIGFVDRSTKISDSLLKFYEKGFIQRFDYDTHRPYECPKGYVPLSIYYIRKDIYDNLSFDDKGFLQIPQHILQEVSNIYSKIEIRKDNEGRSKLVRSCYSLPRYYAYRLFPYSIRSFFALKTILDSDLKRYEYLRRHGNYDLTHDVPYYIESAQNKYKGFYKSHKDRFMDNNKYY